MSWNNLVRQVAVLGMTVAIASSATAAGNAIAADTVIPTVFESGHFYAVPKLVNGSSLRLLVDTGGGMSPAPFVNQAQADVLGLKTDHTCTSDGRTYQVAAPAYVDGQGLPDSSRRCRGVAVLPNEASNTPTGQVVPMYLKGSVWTFDYPMHRLVLRGSAWRASADAHKTRLGFKSLPDGASAGWPRITVRVDGEVLNMLLDTGATAKPGADALIENPRSTTDGIGVGSYIVESTMKRWEKKHPEWKVIAQGDTLFSAYTRMIRVPQIEIAGWHIGPVWFIERPDRAFHGMMAMLMDQPPDGAVGANVFEQFQMTLDYPHKTAWFQQ